MKKYKNVYLTGLEYVEPPEFISSFELEEILEPLYKRFKLHQGRLEELTGVKKRGIWPRSLRPSEIAFQSAKKLLEKSNIKIQDVDLILYAGVCRDTLEPSTSSPLHYFLKAPSTIPHMDLSNACLGVMSAIMLGSDLIESGSMKNILICTAENPASILANTCDKLNSPLETLSRKDMRSSLASLTLGGASVSLLLMGSEIEIEYPRIRKISYMTDSSAYNLCKGTGDYDNPIMETDSEQLLLRGVDLAKELSKRHFEEDGVYDGYLSHQVGSAHEKELMKVIGEKKFQGCKTHITYPDYGNTGSASLPLTLAKILEKKNISSENEKELWLLMGIGSGLSAMMMDLLC